jgi:hypothetical protein
MDGTNTGYLADESGISSSERSTPKPESRSQSPQQTAQLTTESLQIHDGYNYRRRNAQVTITPREYPLLHLMLTRPLLIAHMLWSSTSVVIYPAVVKPN